MKSTLPLFFSLLAAALVAQADDKPLLAIPGKLFYENTFANGIAAPWKIAKGEWVSADGALRGSEKPEDKHPGVARMPLKLQDFIIEYEFKLEGAKMTTLSVNGVKDHMARILAGADYVQVQKDDSDHDGPDKAVVFARMAADLKPGAWHKARMELVGDTMLGKVDDLIAFGSNDLFKNEKGNFGFTVVGQSVDIRNLKVWSATKNPDWDSLKDTLPKPTPAKAGKPGAGKKSAAN
jgi:hypothetical protein